MYYRELVAEEEALAASHQLSAPCGSLQSPTGQIEPPAQEAVQGHMMLLPSPQPLTNATAVWKNCCGGVAAHQQGWSAHATQLCTVPGDEVWSPRALCGLSNPHPCCSQDKSVGAKHDFPAGLRNSDGEPLDFRGVTSWNSQLTDVRSVRTQVWR